VKKVALLQESTLRQNYVHESSKLHNLKDRTFYNWLDFVELVHQNVLRNSGSSIGELWENVKNYVHITGSTAAFTQPVMEYLKNSFEYEIVCADSCAKMYNIVIRESLLSGRSLKGKSGSSIGNDVIHDGDMSAAVKMLQAAPKKSEPSDKGGKKDDSLRFLELERRSKRIKTKASIKTSTKTVSSMSKLNQGEKTTKKKEDLNGRHHSTPTTDLFVVRANLRQQAQLKVDECEESCRETRDKILHKNVYTDTPSASTARDLFSSLISWSRIMCEGIYRASMINGDMNAVEDSLSSNSEGTDPNDAARGHCRMMDNEAEIELCLSYLSTFLELMSKKADLDDWTQVSKHSFIFYAEKLMAFNPEFAYLNVNQDITNRFVKIPRDIVPDDITENKVVGQKDVPSKVTPKPEAKKHALRDMGDVFSAEMLKEQLQSPEGRLVRSEWQVMVVAQRFCSALLPNTNRNMGQRSKLDTYLDHNPRDNPAARVETYLTHWRTTRHNILKVTEEIQRTC
jgi:hypothetical protein